MFIDANAEVEFEAAVEFMDAKTKAVAEVVDADKMVEVEAIAELVDVGAVGVEVVAEYESGLAFFDRPFGCHCDDVFLALSFAFFLLSSSFSFIFYSLSSFLFCFSSASLLFLSSFSFKIASPSELVSTHLPISHLESPFVLSGVAGTYCIKYFEIPSRPGVELLEPGVPDELEAGEETVSEVGNKQRRR